MLGQRAERAVPARQLALAHGQRRQPGGVERPGPHAGLDLGARRGVRVDDVAGHREVLVHRLAGDEQVHDLGRAFEDPVDPQVAHHLLDPDGALAAGGQRIGRLVPAAAPDLHEVVRDGPGHLAAEQFDQRGLDADVVVVVIGEHAAELQHGLHAVGRRRHKRDLASDRLVTADGPTPLHAVLRPLPGHGDAPLTGPDTVGRQRQPAGVQGGQRDLEALALLADEVLLRHADLVEAGDAVLQSAQAHEPVAAFDGDALAVGLHDERADTAAVAVRLRYLGHDDEQAGDRAIGGPQLDAVEDVVALGRRRRGRAQPGRVGADVGLGEQERGDLALGQAGQELLLLFLGAEQLERLRHADGLVGRDERGERRVGRTDEHQGPAVVQIGQAQAAILRIDLHAERAELGQSGQDLVRDAGVALDLPAVDVRDERLERLQVRLAPRGLLRVRTRPRIDQPEREAAEEELLAEARLAPLRLAGGLGDLTGLPFAHVPGGRRSGRGGIDRRARALGRRHGITPCKRAAFYPKVTTE
jgi:hypothetical protein